MWISLQNRGLCVQAPCSVIFHFGLKVCSLCLPKTIFVLANYNSALWFVWKYIGSLLTFVDKNSYQTLHITTWRRGIQGATESCWWVLSIYSLYTAFKVSYIKLKNGNLLLKNILSTKLCLKLFLFSFSSLTHIFCIWFHFSCVLSHKDFDFPSVMFLDTKITVGWLWNVESILNQNHQFKFEN